MTRKHRPFGKNEISEERGRDKNKTRVNARKKTVRVAAKKAVDDEAITHRDLMNAYRL